MPNYSTLQRRRNIIVGVFVAIALCAFLWLIYIFRELPVFVGGLRSFRLYVNFPSAPGVQENTPVQYCGYQVGRVVEIRPPSYYTDPETGRSYPQISLTLAIEKRYRDIPSNISVNLMRRGLGSSYIDLEFDAEKPIIPDAPDSPKTGFLVNGMVLEGKLAIGSDFFPKAVQQKLETLVDSINALAVNVNEIVGDPENRSGIKQTLENMTIMTKQATETLKAVKKFSENTSITMDDTAARLDSMLGELQEMLAKVNSGEGTAGRLLNDGRLYENLLDSSEELRLALEQLKFLVAEMNEKGIKVKL